MPPSELTLVETTRTLTGRHQTARRFLDFAVDGEPLYPRVLAAGFENVTGLWLDRPPRSTRWRRRAEADWSVSPVRRLLGEIEPDAPDGRVSLYVCPECGDLGCGAITVSLERQPELTSWRHWAYQNNYEDGVSSLDFEDITFDAAQYQSTLRHALPRRPAR